jgi:hypothetical protein
VGPTDVTARMVLLPIVGIGSPSISGFALAALSTARRGVRGLLRGGGRWRIGIRWYVIAQPLAGRQVILRIEEHLVHVITDG